MWYTAKHSTMMHMVAEKLVEIAKGESDAEKIDAFGRSAFNRFYYASYLITREMLDILNPAWSRTGHKNIPELLTKRVAKKIRKELKKQSDHGLIQPSQDSRYRDQINASISELSDLLQTAYRIRVIADYEPGSKIKINRSGIELGGAKLATAEKWPNRVSKHTKSIMKIWNELGLS